ncbi:metal ABC transporter permease [Rickettsiaceae bacterium]|nr:metal ABC transporter permease [Rickettsiaceae bacterium]
MELVLIISVLTGLIFAPLGCVVLWKRYVYFGDGLAHASMLAVVLSLIFEIPILYAAIINTALFTLIIFKFKGKSDSNAVIGLASSCMLSLALIVSYIYELQFNLQGLLFGDIISATSDDAFILGAILLIVIIFFVVFYSDLLTVIVSKDIAYSREIRVKLLELLFLSILSLAVLITIKIVGALLVTSIILIPAMIARLVSNSPFRMIVIAIIFAELMNAIGAGLSFYFDMPFAPIIILSGGVIYLFLSIITLKIYKKL